MRVALIADVHGNSVALDAVIADLDRHDPDDVVFLGDACANGFDPAGSLRRLRGLGALSVMGNTDADILATPDFYLDRGDFEAETRRVLEISLWGHERLTVEHREFVTSFQPTVELELPRGRQLLAFHGSPRSATDVITSATPDAEVEEMVGDRGNVLAGGHIHVQMLRSLGDRTLINPGSVGLPFVCYGRAGHVPLLPVAQYAILNATDAGDDVRFRSVPLDVETIRAAALDSGMPHAEWWNSQWRA